MKPSHLPTDPVFNRSRGLQDRTRALRLKTHLVHMRSQPLYRQALSQRMIPIYMKNILLQFRHSMIQAMRNS